ncbi:MAG: thioredoxin domain-containing protein [Muribaculaceae bacterium]|nr:thioredoxin domain-containing protein [Muribaculaceae bacterium]
MKTLKSFFTVMIMALAFVMTGCSGANAKVKVLAPGEKLELSKAPERLTVIDFNATWCGPCRAFTPIFDEAAKKYAGKVDFISVDIDQHQTLARQLYIQSIPAVLFIHKDGTKDWSIGLMTAEEFDQRIQDALE